MFYVNVRSENMQSTETILGMSDAYAQSESGGDCDDVRTQHIITRLRRRAK